MKSTQKGFTLIELMIVIAIIAILAAIAIPAYQNYVVKSRTSEAFVLADSLKTMVGTNAASGIALNQGFDSNDVSETENVASATISDAGVIEITTTSRAGDGTITFTPTSAGEDLTEGDIPQSQIEWACTSSIEQKYLPNTCTSSGGTTPP